MSSKTIRLLILAVLLVGAFVIWKRQEYHQEIVGPLAVYPPPEDEPDIGPGDTLPVAAAPVFKQDIEFPFKENDRVEWMGSSSTYIGVWCQTVEFLLNTRHPELKLAFYRETTGGGTFESTAPLLADWMADYNPTLVIFNYGGNDSRDGRQGLPDFKTNMQLCVEEVQALGARAVLVTHQSGDVRMTGRSAFRIRKLYAEEMIQFAQSKNWPVVDIHHPLEALQREAQKDDPNFTINSDSIHITDAGYVAWGYYFYERINPPLVESSVELSADGKVLATTRCAVVNVQALPGVLSFTRRDEVLPLLPPEPLPSSTAMRQNYHPTLGPVLQRAYSMKEGSRLPPRKQVPLEKYSRYMLKVTGLQAGDYEITCNNKPLGAASAAALSDGVNLNSVLLDSGKTAPWDNFLRMIWYGNGLSQIGKTQWRFKLAKTGSAAARGSSYVLPAPPAR